MRQPKLRRGGATRSQTSIIKPWPAPVGGWNARDSLAAMKPQDAVELINFFPKTSFCEMRGGYSSHATGMTGNGKTLAAYNPLSGSNSMWATTASGTYNVTSPGAVGASVAARTSGKHQYVNFGDGTNKYLIMVNGVDKPLYYDGSSWTAVDSGTSPALIGVTTSDLIHVFVSKGRLFFIQKGSLSFWYLPAGAAGGTLLEFDLSAFAKKGGYLMAGDTWTVDGGDGPEDRVVFYTSEGEVIVYVGDNPSSTSFWQLVGVYDVGRPIGRRCMTRYGGDLILISQNGAYPMSAALQSASIDYRAALSNKIETAFTDAARSYGGNFGWEARLFPAQNALLVNVPIAEDGTHEQYVMNTITKAWCKFTGWNAEDFSVMNGELYFTSSTKVYKAWTGRIDGTSNIEAYGKTAFNYFGDGGQKQFVMYRPLIAVNGTLNFLTDIDVDFKDTTITGSATYTPAIAARWDVDRWDAANWAASMEILKEWTSPDEWTGTCASGKVKIATNALTVQWIANEIMFRRGAGI